MLLLLLEEKLFVWKFYLKFFSLSKCTPETLGLIALTDINFILFPFHLSTFGEIDSRFLSNLKEYDRIGSFHFDYEPNEISFGS